MIINLFTNKILYENENNIRKRYKVVKALMNGDNMVNSTETNYNAQY